MCDVHCGSAYETSPARGVRQPDVKCSWSNVKEHKYLQITKESRTCTPGDRVSGVCIGGPVFESGLQTICLFIEMYPGHRGDDDGENPPRMSI